MWVCICDGAHTPWAWLALQCQVAAFIILSPGPFQDLLPPPFFFLIASSVYLGFCRHVTFWRSFKQVLPSRRKTSRSQLPFSLWWPCLAIHRNSDGFDASKWPCGHAVVLGIGSQPCLYLLPWAIHFVFSSPALITLFFSSCKVFCKQIFCLWDRMGKTPVGNLLKKNWSDVWLQNFGSLWKLWWLPHAVCKCQERKRYRIKTSWNWWLELNRRNGHEIVGVKQRDSCFHLHWAMKYTG